MNIRTRAPAEPEQTDGDAEGSHAASVQALLRLDLTILVELRFEVFVHVPEVRRDDDQGSDEDAEIGDTFETEREVVDFDKDDDEGLEPDVEDAVDEGNVQVEQEDHWLGEVERERSDEGHHDDVFAGHVLGHEFGLADQLIVAGDLAETLGATDEDVVRAGFGEEEEEEDQTEPAEPHQLPDGPCPGRSEATSERCRSNSKSCDKWAKCRSTDSCDTPYRHGVGTLRWAVHVGERSTTCC